MRTLSFRAKRLVLSFRPVRWAASRAERNLLLFFFATCTILSSQHTLWRASPTLR